MTYYIRKNDDLFLGPYGLEDLRSMVAKNEVEAEWLAVRAGGQSHRQLKKNSEWITVRELLESDVNEGLGEDTKTEATGTIERPGMLAMSSKPVLVCAVVLLAAFFLPWVQFMGMGLSGYNLGQMGSYGNFAWIIPVLSGSTILLSFSRFGNKIIGAITGIVPICAIIYGLIRVEMEGGSQALNEVLQMAGHTLSIGAWLTIIFSIAILITAVASKNTIK